VLAYTKDLVGNMGLGIILITLLLKLLLFPLANKSYRSMSRMNAVQPKIQELRKKYEGDNTKLGQAVSELYKKENINPVGGCLPLLLQSPVLFALYKVLYVSIEMRQAPFMWWIRDLSAADPLTVLNLFGLIPINLPGFLQIGIWPLLMGLTMLAQQKMSPAPADPAQANMMLIMPIMFTFMFAQLPSGLVIYWTFSNLLGIAQQWAIKRLDENSPVPSAKKS
jgi:YidC/Oxa1 family membrane protein insertase